MSAIEFVDGYSVLLRRKDGSEFLARGSEELPFFTTRWKQAHIYRKALLVHSLKGKVVPAKGAVVRKPCPTRPR